MKDPLRQFTNKTALNQLSPKVLTILCEHIKGGFAEKHPELHKGREKKKSHLKAAIAYIKAAGDDAEAECTKLTKLSYFYKENPKCLPKLITRLSASSKSSQAHGLLKGYVKTADKALLLSIHFYDDAFKCFLASNLRIQKNTFWQVRDDYSQKPFEDIKANIPKLKDSIIAYFTAQSRGEAGFPKIIDDGDDYFYTLAMPDTEREARLWVDDKPKDTSIRPVMDVAIYFNKKTGAVSIHASDANTKCEMHKICAEIVYGERDILKEQKRNEIYDLKALLQKVVENKPIAPLKPQKVVRRVVVNLLKLEQMEKRRKTVELNAKLKSVDMLDSENDYASEMHYALTELLEKDSGAASQWAIGKMQAIRAELYVTYYDEHLGTETTKEFSINRYGTSNLGYDEVDIAIKEFLTDAGIIKKREIEQETQAA